jgi:hypothetical protein
MLFSHISSNPKGAIDRSLICAGAEPTNMHMASIVSKCTKRRESIGCWLVMLGLDLRLKKGKLPNVSSYSVALKMRVFSLQQELTVSSKSIIREIHAALAVGLPVSTSFPENRQLPSYPARLAKLNRTKLSSPINWQ